MNTLYRDFDTQAQIDAAEAATSNQRVSRQTYAVFGGRDYD